GYIVTNAHVTDLTHQGEDKGKQLLFIEFVKQLAHDYGKDPRAILNSSEALAQIENQFQPRDFRHIHHVVLPDGSVFPFEIKAFGAPTGEGKDVSIIKIEVKNAPVLKLGNSDKIQLQDHITVLGYPAAADTDVLDQKSALEASITDGKVSAKKSSSEGAPILQVSAPSTHGNSGGPVLNDKGEVIGMLTFRGDTVNGQEVQGFNFVVPSSTVMEYVKQAGATNQEGPADKSYREGLELYWNNEFTAAIKKFETARSLFPQHSEADKLIRDSQQAIAEGKESSGPGLGMIAGIALLLAAGGGGAFVFLKKKNAASQSTHTMQPQQQFQPAQQTPQRTAGYPSYNPAAKPAVQVTQTIGMSSFPAAAAVATAKTGTAPLSKGVIRWTTGPLAGQHFEVKAEGMTIGREAMSAQIVINDSRVSSRHAWVGVRDGRVVLEDTGSTNGTFVNSISAGRIRQVTLNSGDTVIISEADAARFIYQE
ncbi:MAG: trypsin-like peptidase domain-containing protein, partial [Blastocatellia bacterium]